MEQKNRGRSPVRTELVEHLVNELYQSHQELRTVNWLKGNDRRVGDRRSRSEPVIIDTRSSQSRRNQAGRRWGDDNKDNRQKIGIDDYA